MVWRTLGLGGVAMAHEPRPALEDLMDIQSGGGSGGVERIGVKPGISAPPPRANKTKQEEARRRGRRRGKKERNKFSEWIRRESSEADEK